PAERVPEGRVPSRLAPAGLATSCEVVSWLLPAGTDTPMAPSARCATPWGPFGSVPVPTAMTIATTTTTTVPPTRARRFCRPPPLRVRRAFVAGRVGPRFEGRVPPTVFGRQTGTGAG